MTQAYAPIELPLPLLLRLEAELGSDAPCPGLDIDCNGVPRQLWEQCLLGPLREFLTRTGKELRAALVLSAWEIAGGRAPLPSEAKLLVEVLHAGSLIIDDIQDGSTVRRGGRSLHLVIGEPLAINAGNWLYFYAEELAGQLGLAPTAELELRRSVAKAVLHCHYGQALDLSTQIGMLAQRQVPELVRVTTSLKTGSLFELAAEVGAICAEAGAGVTQALARFGQALEYVLVGIGFEPLNDLFPLA
jgi:geranylgeranyl pyrophosphate synthase